MKLPCILSIGLFLFLLTGKQESNAQIINLIHTIGGGGSSLAEGVPATSANITTAAGNWTDAAGNIYISDEVGYKTRRIDAVTGLIYTVAGTGFAGLSGDGGPATAAQLEAVRSIRLDAAGNLYLGDYGNLRVRKVNAITGIITTVAGGGSSTLDGIPATNASLNFLGIDVDNAGNIYTYGGSRVRKVNASTGTISTVAGGGSSMAEGVPATTASVDQPRFMVTDAAGSLYILNSSGSTVRRVDAYTGLINTVAGGGTSTLDGVPATSFSFSDYHSIAIDPSGNLVLMDRTHGLIRWINRTTGIMNIIAGGGTSTADNVPATTADLNSNHWLHIDGAGNYYISNWSGGLLRKINDFPITGTLSSDSLHSYISNLCNGPQITIAKNTFISGQSIKTYFGDGATDSSVVVHGFISGAYVSVNHSYNTSGSYLIKHVLYTGTTPTDTLSYVYHYTFCRSLPVKIYYEGNGDCVKELSEPFMTLSSKIEVDSNGISIDTIPATAGLNYYAYGAPGSVYSFKLVSLPGDLYEACPAGGVLYDTVQSTVSSYPEKHFGLSCPGGTSFDLALNTVVPVTGINDQWGHIYIANAACAGMPATVTLNFSPKWIFSTGESHPAPTSVAGTTASWDIGAVSANDPLPFDIYYVLRDNPATGSLTIADTVHGSFKVTPVVGDLAPANNIRIRQDTIKGGCDPNEMFVDPQDCFPYTSGTTQLQYTINFTNTGNDTAHNIYVMDTLANELDPHTVSIVMASAQMNMTKYKDGGYYILRFDMPQINLLDSSHHGQCDGAVIFTIKTLPGLASGTNILSHAGIFFDENGVVMTNTVRNTVGCPTPLPVKETDRIPGIEVYPNPATDEINLIVETQTDNYFSVLNTLGKVVIDGKVSSLHTTLNVSRLPPGIYTIKLDGNNGTHTARFAKF